MYSYVNYMLLEHADMSSLITGYNTRKPPPTVDKHPAICVTENRLHYRANNGAYLVLDNTTIEIHRDFCEV